MKYAYSMDNNITGYQYHRLIALALASCVLFLLHLKPDVPGHLFFTDL